VLTGRPGFVDQELFAAPIEEAAAFAGGVATASGDMPASGSATYSGAAIAMETDGASKALDLMTGQFVAKADFTANTISGHTDLDSANTGLAWGSIDTGTMSFGDGAAFSGSQATSSRGHTGQANGEFFGPGAAEVGGVFKLQSEGSVVTGGFGAKK
jgi:hypothetical protein